MQAGNAVHQDCLIGLCCGQPVGGPRVNLLKIGRLRRQYREQLLHLSVCLLDLRCHVGCQPADGTLDTAKRTAVLTHGGKAEKRQQPVGFQLDNPLHNAAHAVRRNALVEQRNPRESGRINVKGEMQLRIAIAEVIRGNGTAVHRRHHLFRGQAAWRFAADFQPDSVEDRRRNAARPGQRKMRYGGIKRIGQQAGGLSMTFLNKADRHEFGMLLDAQRIAIHLDPQELGPGGDRFAPGSIQKGIDIVKDGTGITIGQEDIADEPPGPLKIMKGAGMQLIRQGASQRKFFHFRGSLPVAGSGS